MSLILPITESKRRHVPMSPRTRAAFQHTNRKSRLKRIKRQLFQLLLDCRDDGAHFKFKVDIEYFCKCMEIAINSAKENQLKLNPPKT